MNKNVLYYLWLAGAFSYGSVKLGLILEKEPDACAFYHQFRCSTREFPFLKRSDLESLQKHTPSEYEEQVLECQRNDIHILCYTDEVYPERLRQIDSPPPVLYYRGDPAVLAERCIAMVGTRHSSEYGKQTTYRIAQKLAAYGIVIVSGCAGGIDTFAHIGALEEGKTVAVLGTPLNRNYPAFNAELKRQILEKGGLIISEYPIGAPIHRGFFPIRNRLISALSDAVLVMEAPQRSGALITASCAVEQGTDVFCLPPADIGNKRYDGVKGYLRDGARPLLDASDVLEFYRFSRPPLLSNLPEWESLDEKEEQIQEQKERQKEPTRLSDEAKKVFLVLSDRPREAEEIMQLVSVPPNGIFSALTELELAGLIFKRGSGYYKKCIW